MFETNINTEEKGLLRFTTAGSVDDGKSTLIGRLLYDSKSIFEDQLLVLEETSKRRGKAEIDLSLLTDGLRAEREQGITIDVAYRYFSTPNRKFIIADTPGHIQYTRNMVTGASTANLALILVDARNGVIEQSIRHTFISSLLNIRHIVFCINKMDLVGFEENVFNDIRQQLTEISEKLKVHDARFIPISAKYGDNVVEKSENMPWYQGNTLLHLLETIEISHDWDTSHPRFPVQYVIRPLDDQYHDYRGYAGRVSGGTFTQGDTVVVLPSMMTSSIQSIYKGREKLMTAGFNESVVVRLEDDIDISRGDMIVSPDHLPSVSNELTLMVCWFAEYPLQNGGKYVLRHTTAEMKCIVKEVKYKMNINTLQQDNESKQVGLNDIVCLTIKTTKPVFFDEYRENTITGSLILVNEATNETVAAGMIQPVIQ